MAFPRGTQTDAEVVGQSRESIMLERVRERISVSPEPSTVRSFSHLNPLRLVVGQSYFPNVISSPLVTAAAGTDHRKHG